MTVLKDILENDDIQGRRIMSEEQMIRHCSPTLAGMKSGAVYTDIEEIRVSVCGWNKRLRDKGLRIIPLCFRENGL